jgi:ribose transport system substrate-binding protein
MEGRNDGPGHGLSRRTLLRRTALGAGALALPGLLAACGEESAGGGAAAQAPTGTLQPFDPNVAPGPATGLDKAFGFPGAFADPLSTAFSDQIRATVGDAGFEYRYAVANGDLAKVTAQTETVLSQGVSALFMYPINEEATRPLAQRALDAGACVFGGAGRPYSTVQFGEDQALLGKRLGGLAAEWIRSNLDGKAKVAYFNEDSSATIIPRHEAAIAALEQVGPGVEIVSDIEIKLDPESGAEAMATILQAHPDVNVVLAGAGPMGGILSVFEAKGKATDPGIYLGSVAGGDADFEYIERGDSIYRSTLTTPFPIFGCAVGQFTVDWQAGRSIPRVITVPGGIVELGTPEAVREYRADLRDPARAWETKRDRYVAMWGNISYAERDTYWREEAKFPRSA